jgi:hypothetical protein
MKFVLHCEDVASCGAESSWWRNAELTAIRGLYFSSGTLFLWWRWLENLTVAKLVKQRNRGSSVSIVVRYWTRCELIGYSSEACSLYSEGQQFEHWPGYTLTSLRFIDVFVSLSKHRLATDWRVRGWNSGVDEISRACPGCSGTHPASCIMSAVSLSRG